jgi:phage tail sheath protein FI
VSELLASKVVVLEEEPSVRGIPSLSTSVTGAVGITERGPVGQAVLCTSFGEYQARFGGFTRNSDLALAAAGFFENGGTQLWVVRTGHFADPSDRDSLTALRATANVLGGTEPGPAVLEGDVPAPFVMAPGERLALTVNGTPAAEVAFEARPAVVTSSAGPFALATGQTLTVRVDGSGLQTARFEAAEFADITAASAGEVTAVLNREFVGVRVEVAGDAVRIASDTEGLASRVHITGGTANGALGFATSPATGTGNVASIRAVTAAEVKTAVESAVQGVRVDATPSGGVRILTRQTGVAASLRASGAAATTLRLDPAERSGTSAASAIVLLVEGKDPGAYANRLTVAVQSRGEDAFDLRVLEGGIVREPFVDLSLDLEHPRFVETIVNDAKSGSALIRGRALVVAKTTVPSQSVTLAGGSDGLDGLTDQDFIGAERARTGLYTLNAVQDLSLLMAPGRATPGMHHGLLRYCEVTRGGSVFPILDPPPGRSATEMVDYVTSAALENASEFGAIYWPWVLILNPSRAVFGSAAQLAVPPSGIVAGVFARNDAARPGGIYEAPAGVENGRMFGVLGFETDEVLDERKRDLVYPRRINPLTTGPGLPRFIDGSRTLKGNGNFPYVAERRGVSFIARSLKQGLEFARHKNNTEGLRAQVRRTLTAFLLTQMNNGAFRTRDPETAFFVDVSEALNTPEVIFAGKLLARVGLATNKPAEFIVITISQDTRALDAALAVAGG